MSNFYDLNSVNGCREFLSVLMDNYVPTQLADFPIGFVDRAISNFKDECVSLQDITGNSIYMECTKLLNEALYENLEDELNELLENENDLSDEEQVAYSWALENMKKETSLWEIISCYANGSLDSHLYLNELSDEQIFVLQSVEKRTGIIHDSLDIVNTDVKDIETIYNHDSYEPELSVSDMTQKNFKSLGSLDDVLKNQNLIGKRIRIEYMEGEPHYAGRQGVVESIDDAGQLHGSWGGLAVLSTDQFSIIGEKFKLFDDTKKNKDFFEKEKDEFLNIYADITETEYDDMVNILSQEETNAYENLRFPSESKEYIGKSDRKQNER